MAWSELHAEHWGWPTDADHSRREGAAACWRSTDADHSCKENVGAGPSAARSAKSWATLPSSRLSETDHI
eukprot:4222699-Pyramimonas_sp.AAC.1